MRRSVQPRCCSSSDGRTMGTFAVAVRAVIENLESSGFEILEAVFDASHTPHVVAERNDRLQFVLVQGIEGPYLADFSEETHYARMLALVEAITWHPKGAEVGRRAQANQGDARLAIVGLLWVEPTEQGAEPAFMAKVFPYRTIDPTGHIFAMGDCG